MDLANLKYLRVKVFYALLDPFSRRMRQKRMASFEKWGPVRVGARVLDLGGEPAFWGTMNRPLDITVLNLPGGPPTPVGPSIHNLVLVEGDACHVDAFAAQSFEIVFSNSVIEHVGPADNQEAFAREVRRLGRSYWVQTPSIWFPIECHTGMPFWWLYPAALQSFFLRRWRKKLPEWTSYIEQTRVLSKRRMQQLFPEATIDVERFLGLAKSYVARYAPSE